MDDLEQAVRIALEPLSVQGGWELCSRCGMTKIKLGEHECSAHPLVDLPGLGHDDAKRRAKTYAIQ